MFQLLCVFSFFVSFVRRLVGWLSCCALSYSSSHFHHWCVYPICYFDRYFHFFLQNAFNLNIVYIKKNERRKIRKAKNRQYVSVSVCVCACKCVYCICGLKMKKETRKGTIETEEKPFFSSAVPFFYCRCCVLLPFRVIIEL